MTEREPVRAELEAQNIVYRPVVWTCFGRPHTAAQEVVRAIARRIARRRGRVLQRAIAEQMRAAFSVCIARRAARMSLVCWPQHSPSVAAANAQRHFELAPGDGV